MTSKWEIKVYAFSKGHLYTIHSDAKLESVKSNMMRRFKLHRKDIGIITVRDLHEDNIVHVREIMKSGIPRYRNWRKIRYSITVFPDKSDWDNSVNKQMKGC